MTGLECNRQMYLPQEIQDRLPKSGEAILGCASVNRHSWGSDPESQGANSSAYYPRDQSLFGFYTIMVLKEKNDHKFFLRRIIMKNNISSN